MMDASTGRTWIANVNGLCELKENKVLPAEISHPAFLSRIEALEELPDGTLVIGSKGYGIIFWKGQRIASLTQQDGLTTNMIKNLYVDDQGVLWAGTLNGLNRIRWNWNTMPPEVKIYTIAHGLPSNEINKVDTWGDTIWVATVNGLAQFLDKKTSNKISPQPVIASVLAAGKPLKLSELVPVPFIENSLKINFFAVNFKMAGRIPYRYRMDKGNWAQTFNTSLDFPAVPHGSHRFEVQAQNEDGVWSDASAFYLYIKPPWYATWWLRGLAVAALAGTVFGFYKYRTHQLKRENEMQRQVVELERSALQAQMNPHFIFNCLNAIQNFILQNEKDQAIEYLARFARLVRGVLNASVAGHVTVQEELQMLENYLSLEQLRFNSRFEYEVRAAEGLDVFNIEIPPLLVQPYVENAVLHGTAGRDSGGKVLVEFRQGVEALEITVEDNGNGLHQANQQNNPKGHKSVGMGITQRRLELLAGRNGSPPVIVDLRPDGKDKAQGTKIRIFIPL